MARPKSMKNAPTDRPILICVGGKWIQAEWEASDWEGEPGKWRSARLNSHGCGCCSFDDPAPTAWAELPKEQAHG